MSVSNSILGRAGVGIENSQLGCQEEQDCTIKILRNQALEEKNCMITILEKLKQGQNPCWIVL